ncbi:MAG TPA: amidotransferase [Thiopseudomonas sp.]|nr:amidotransferase [Thiopseudomonas sp.]
MTLQVCILEADDLHPSLESEFVSYGQMFQRLFSGQGVDVACQIFNVVAGQYPANGQRFDAYLVTGSKADSFANDPWIVTLREYLAERYQSGDVLLGVCFGHQILALVLGGTTQRSDKGWGIGMHRYRLKHKPAWLTEAEDEFQLLISHRDQVTDLPEQATLLASSEFCENAGFVVGQQVLCFQGHPEFTHEFSRGLLKLRESIYCPEHFQQAKQSLACEHDGQLVAQWMLSFVQTAKEHTAALAENPAVVHREPVCTV